MNLAQPQILGVQKISRRILIFTLFLAMTFGLQHLGDAYKSEFGSHPDEAAHYVTGLMVRDYVAAGFPGNPMKYAQNYYDHYPKVALGHWPPIFYLGQASWTLFFSPSRFSILLFIAVLTALLATVFFFLLRKEFNFGRALGGALLLLAIPLLQQAFGAVMTEVPVALLILIATIYFGRYLQSEKKADAILFGLVASIAILTKFSGFLLALVPVFGLLLSRKFYLLKRLSFWWPALLVPALCGPWTFFTLKLASDGMADGESVFTFLQKAAPFYSTKLFFVAGAVTSILAMIGMLEKVFNKNKVPSSMSLAMGSLLLSVWTFHILVPCGYEARHLVTALPALIFFAVAGADCLVGLLHKRGFSKSFAVGAIYGLAVFAFLGGTFKIPKKGYRGFGPVAETLLKNPAASTAKFLVSSDARGEGMFISEVAMREKRPGHVIQRASKAFSKSSWSGGNYETKFQDADAVAEFLRQSNISYLILDTSLPKGATKPHHELLLQAVERDAAHFSLVTTSGIARAGTRFPHAIKVFQIR